MSEPEIFTLSVFIIGLRLIVMALGDSFLSRALLSSAMLYLGVEMVISPLGLDSVRLAPSWTTRCRWSG